MTNSARYAKAVVAFATTLVGALTTAVMTAPGHTFGAVDTLGWLSVAATVLLTTGGVYQVTNKPDPPLPLPPGPVAVHKPPKKAAKNHR